MKKCLIYVENENAQDAVDLIEAVDHLYGRENAMVFGFGCLEALKNGEGFFDVLIPGETEKSLEYDVKNITNCMEALHQAYGFDSILIPANYVGRMLAPRLSMRLNTGLTADVTAIESDGDNIELIRPAYSGKLMAAIKNRGGNPLMMSVRQKVFQWEKPRAAKSEWRGFSFDTIEEPEIKFIGIEKQEAVEDIRESEVLVAGGGGSAGYFKELKDLAKALNGQVAASRKIVDREIAPRSIQVGQSGKTISPKLYIAIGISGAIQHIEGLKTPDHIIAVNKKSRAPICSIADLVVVGDGKEFIRKLLQRIYGDTEHTKYNE